MGQAKLRGSKEERKAQALAAAQADKERRLVEMARREALLTPEQRAARERKLQKIRQTAVFLRAVFGASR